MGDAHEAERDSSRVITRSQVEGWVDTASRWYSLACSNVNDMVRESTTET